MKNVSLWVFDALLISFLIAGLFFLFEFRNSNVIAPLPYEEESLVFTFPQSSYILISLNESFVEPNLLPVNDGVGFHLSEGTYYFRTEKPISFVYWLSLEKPADFIIRMSQNLTKIYYSGEENYKLTVFNSTSIIGQRSLESSGRYPIYLKIKGDNYNEL